MGKYAIQNGICSLYSRLFQEGLGDHGALSLATRRGRSSAGRRSARPPGMPSAAAAGPFQQGGAAPSVRPPIGREGAGRDVSPAPPSPGPAPRGGLAVWSGAAETGLSAAASCL